MKGAFAFGASVLASVAYAQQSGPACDAISYDFSKFSGSLQYKSVTKYAWDMAQCAMNPVTISGPIAPLDQGLTPIFRGPIRLKQLAVYNEGGSSQKRSVKASPRERRHNAHERFHKKHAEAEPDAIARAEAEAFEKRECGQPIVATYPGGGVFTMTQNWDCGSGAAATPAPASSPAAPQVKNAAYSAPSSQASSQAAGSVGSPAAPTKSSAPSTYGGTSSTSSGTGSGAWNQVAYYSASSPSSSKNVTFLYSQPYGNVGYLPSNGDATGSPASSPQALNDVLIPDNSQFYVASGVEMANNPAPENKAYHGFAGNKIFLVEISMPLSGSSSGQNPDMPAFWLLNEQIPVTNQYGQCSCWASGCGEFDVHEVLSKGANIGYSTMHMGQQYCGGASNGFKRATTGTQKLAVIIKSGSSASNSVVRVVQLDDNYNFGNSISESDYQSWVGKSTTGGALGTLQTGSSCPNPAGLSY